MNDKPSTYICENRDTKVIYYLEGPTLKKICPTLNAYLPLLSHKTTQP